MKYTFRNFNSSFHKIMIKNWLKKLAYKMVKQILVSYFTILWRLFDPGFYIFQVKRRTKIFNSMCNFLSLFCIFIFDTVLHYCVTLCESRLTKNTNISFHEFPSDNDMKSAWLNAISQKEFYQNSESNSSRVIASILKSYYAHHLRNRDAIENIS